MTIVVPLSLCGRDNCHYYHTACGYQWCRRKGKGVCACVHDSIVPQIMTIVVPVSVAVIIVIIIILLVAIFCHQWCRRKQKDVCVCACVYVYVCVCACMHVCMMAEF